MATAIGLTAALWESGGSGSSTYGPLVKTVDWNSWEKYFVCSSAGSSGYAVDKYTGTNLGDVIFPTKYTDNNNEYNVVRIRSSVFADETTKKLPVTIYISGSITTIDDATFSSLPNLQKLVLAYGSNMTVGKYAFAGCSQLTEIVIDCSSISPFNPRNVVFGDYALMGCTSLTTIRFNGTIAQWSALTHGTGWNANTGNYTVYCNDGTVPKA